MGKVFTETSPNNTVVEQLEQQIESFFTDVLKTDYMYVHEPWLVEEKYKKIKKLIDELKR